VWWKSLFYEFTTCAYNNPLLKPFYGGLRGRFPCFTPISYHSPQKPSNIRAIYQSDHDRADALSWLEATNNRLYDAGKEEELENDEMLNYRLGQEE